MITVALNSRRISYQPVGMGFRVNRRGNARHGYYVDTQDWPTGASDNDLSAKEIFETLEDFDEYYDGAVQSLAKIPSPFSSTP
jgi:hypothetical protein